MLLRQLLLIGVALLVILSWRAAGVSTAGQEPDAVKRCTHGWKNGYTWQYSLEQWQEITECVVWKPPVMRFGPCNYYDPATYRHYEEGCWIVTYPVQDAIVGWKAEQPIWLHPE